MVPILFKTLLIITVVLGIISFALRLCIKMDKESMLAIYAVKHMDVHVTTKLILFFTIFTIAAFLCGSITIIIGIIRFL